MGNSRTLWHLLLAALYGERAPRGVEVRSEVALSAEPQRADLLLLRRIGARRAPGDGSVTRGLWPRLGSDTILEYKSPARPFRRRDLNRLVGYAMQYDVTQAGRLDDVHQLSIVLAVPAITPTLRADVERMSWSLRDVGDGYHAIERCPYRGWVVELGPVADAENDDLLGVLAGRRIRTKEAARWLWEHTMHSPNKPALQQLEGYDEVVQAALSQLTPAERLRGLTPKERLEGLTPDQQLEVVESLPAELGLLMLPDELLRALPDDVLGKLAPEVRERIRKRLGR